MGSVVQGLAARLVVELARCERALMRPWTFRIVVASLVALMASVQISTSFRESQTYDEGLHLSSGFSYLTTGRYRIGLDHPPLGKMLNALPPLWLGARLEAESKAWEDRDELGIAHSFMFKNAISAERILYSARMMTICMTAALGLAVALICRRWFGPLPAVFALFLFVTDPSLIAHGHYVTTDMVITLFAFLSSIAWGSYLLSHRWHHLVLAGVALGLAMTSKYSGIMFVAPHALVYAASRLRNSRQRTLSVPEVAIGLLVLVAVAGVSVGLVYWPETLRALRGAGSEPLTAKADRSMAIGRALYAIADLLHLPAHAFVVGFQEFFRHSQLGHNGYLLGRRGELGWWYYFPVAFAVKTPTAVLALVVATGVASVPMLRASLRRSTVKSPVRWYAVIIPAVFYFTLSLTSHVNIGFRHLLPVLPFLFIALSAFVLGPLRARFPAAAASFALLVVPVQLLESALAFPNHLAFFNTLSGGSKRGARYLLDSNIDWGQGLKELKAYMTENKLDRVCFAYFGTADLKYYGIEWLPIPATNELEARRSLNCVVAISVNVLHDMFSPPGSFQWLRELEPSGRIMDSIYLYDLRKPKRAPEAEPAVAASLSADPSPIPLCEGTRAGATTISWVLQDTVAVELRVGAPNGPVMATATSSGAAATGNWVGQGTVFFLQRAGATGTESTLAKLSVDTVEIPCR